jgi:hypothetical protein
MDRDDNSIIAARQAVCPFPFGKGASSEKQKSRLRKGRIDQNKSLLGGGGRG